MFFVKRKGSPKLKLMAALLTGGHFWPQRTNGLGCRVAIMMADDDAQDWADRIGRRVATLVIVLLIALFAYGYPSPLVFR